MNICVRRRVLACSIFLCLPVFGQDGAQSEAGETKQDASDILKRKGTVTQYADRGRALETLESVTWFDVGGEQQWMVERQASGSVKGSVLIIAAPGDSTNGAGHLANLRQHLPQDGWHTFYTNMSEQPIDELLLRATAQIPNAKNLLLICAKRSCEALAPIKLASFAGSVFINVPYTEHTRLNPNQRDVWQAQSMPILVLQEHPFAWPRELTLAVGFELHLLPMGNAHAENSRILRKLKGWLKRQLKVG